MFGKRSVNSLALRAVTPMPRHATLLTRVPRFTEPGQMCGSSMERSYIILLDRGGGYSTRRQRGGFGVQQPIDFAAQMGAEPPRPKLHRERLTAQELQEVAQEPDFVAA